MPRKGVVDPKEEQARLEAHLTDIDAQLARLAAERVAAKKQLEEIRLQRIACPKCGRDRDFMTDAGGFLAHVLEDPDDRELLAPNKPLFCPNCGEVFLYRAPKSP